MGRIGEKIVMKKNIGTPDRIFRLAIALALFAYAYFKMSLLALICSFLNRLEVRLKPSSEEDTCEIVHQIAMSELFPSQPMHKEEGSKPKWPLPLGGYEIAWQHPIC